MVFVFLFLTYFTGSLLYNPTIYLFSTGVVTETKYVCVCLCVCAHSVLFHLQPKEEGIRSCMGD